MLEFKVVVPGDVQTLGEDGLCKPVERRLQRISAIKHHSRYLESHLSANSSIACAKGTSGKFGQWHCQNTLLGRKHLRVSIHLKHAHVMT